MAQTVFVRVKDNPGMEGAQRDTPCTFDKDLDDRKGNYKGTNVSPSGSGGGGGGGKGKGKGKGKSDRYEAHW